jgi:hypothetical protein
MARVLRIPGYPETLIKAEFSQEGPPICKTLIKSRTRGIRYVEAGKTVIKAEFFAKREEPSFATLRRRSTLEACGTRENRGETVVKAEFFAKPQRQSTLKACGREAKSVKQS